MSKFTIKDFRSKYPNDNACLKELMKRKFGNLSECPNPDCGKRTKFHRVKGRKVYECQWCGYQISPTAGTIFHKSATPLTDWFYVMYLMTATRAGVSAKEVERQLGVTYKTAWRMCHQIRKAMMDDGDKLKSNVEVDETFVGGKAKNRKSKWGEGSNDKEVLMGMVERGGKARIRHIPNTGKWTLIEQVKKNIDSKARVITDDYRGYTQLGKLGYNHQTVNHSAGHYRIGDVYTQNIENVWSHMKRGITGVYRHVSPQHLQKYANEYAFRYNQRTNLTPMFERLLQNLVRLS